MSHGRCDASHYIKAVKWRGAKIYCKETFNNMLIVSMLILNNKANKTNEE
ncbi:hypothetical protein [Spiroplasma endosymbiont of Polydrusus formosus]